MILLTDEELEKVLQPYFVQGVGYKSGVEKYEAIAKAQALKLWTELKEKYGGWYDGTDYCIEMPKEDYEQIEKELEL